MQNFIKAAVVAFGGLGALAIPANAQPYEDPQYEDPGDYAYNQDYGAPAYGDPASYTLFTRLRLL